MQFFTRLDALILSNETGPCFICGKQTPWIEISFEGFLCSSACARRADMDALHGPVLPTLDKLAAAKTYRRFLYQLWMEGTDINLYTEGLRNVVRRLAVLLSPREKQQIAIETQQYMNEGRVSGCWRHQHDCDTCPTGCADLHTAD